MARVSSFPVMLLMVVYVDHSRAEQMVIRIISATKASKITPELQQMYERDKRLDTDPDAPTLPPEMWRNAVVGKFYRPLKTAVSVRIDNDVLAWLKAQGDGYLTRINDILRHAMLAQPKR